MGDVAEIPGGASYIIYMVIMLIQCLRICTLNADLGYSKIYTLNTDFPGKGYPKHSKVIKCTPKH